MAGRHQAQYTRYVTSNPPYQSTPTGSNNSHLNVPYNSQTNAAQGAGYSSTLAAAHSTTPAMTSPYSTSSSSPSYHSPNIPKHSSHNPPLRKYTLQPPARQLPLCKSLPALGYPGVFPQHPNQEEDKLTESNVRTGFIDKPAVSNEHTCAHDMVYGKLQDDQRLLSDLGQFAVEVLKRKRNAALITGPSSFKPPIRSTLIESKKEQWMQELANGVVPLRKLARNVPHGFKGEKLLETLAARQAPFLRATWFIKVVGLSEMAQRNSSSNAPSTSQAHQWTITVTNHLKRQLTELMPSSSLGVAGGNASRSYKGHPTTPSSHHDNSSKPWANPQNRARFEQRWSYSTKLTRWQYFEGLLDQRTFLKWSLDALAASATLEMMWLLLMFIVQDYVDEYKRNRTLTKLLIETLIKAYGALLQHMTPAQGDANSTIYKDIKTYIEHLLQSLFLSTPDIFVAPKLYHQYRHLFEAILGGETTEEASQALPDVHHVMRSYWAMVKARNEVFCGTVEENQLRLDNNGMRPMIQSELQSDRDQSAHATEDSIIRTLDSIGRHIDSGTGLLMGQNGWMDRRGQTAESAANAIFGSDVLTTTSLLQITSVMCRWATSESRSGEWRPYLIASILLHWRDQEDTENRATMLQNVLIQWLDNEIGPEDNEDPDMTANQSQLAKPSVVFLFDTMIRLHLFSYQKYLLRLLARGDLEPHKRHRPRTQCCVHYLASFPLLTPAPVYLVNQRRVALYGTRNGSEDKAEQQLFNQLKQLARRAVATTAVTDWEEDVLFGPDAKNMTQPHDDQLLEPQQLKDSLAAEQEAAQVMRDATRFTLLNFTSKWLVPNIRQFVVESVPIGEDNWRVMTSPGSSLLNARQFIMIVKLLEHAMDYINIIDVTCWVLEKTNEPGLYPLIVDTFRRHANVWKLTNTGETIAKSVWAKHQQLLTRGTRERSLMMYMVQLVQEGYAISDEMRAQLQHDLQFKPKVISYAGRNNTIASSDFSSLLSNPTSSSVQNLAETICSRYQNAPGWIAHVFEIATDSLFRWAADQQAQDRTVLHLRVEAVSNVLKKVADQVMLTGQLDKVILEWLSRQCSPTSTSAGLVLSDMQQPRAILPLFVAMLAARRLIGIDLMMTHFVLVWLGRIEHEIQKHYDSQWTTDSKPLMHFSKNLIVLIHLLIVQNETNDQSPLGFQDIFLLQVQRPTQLASSHDKLDIIFALIRSAMIITASLPLSNALIQDLTQLRSDVLQLDWFRRACSRDVNSIYQHLDSSHAVGEGEIKKQMLRIVDGLIEGNMHIERNMLPETPLRFADKLQAVFTNLNLWNEDLCRVQLNLLLDNVAVTNTTSDTTAMDTRDVLNSTSSSSSATAMGSVAMDTHPEPSNAGDLGLFVRFFFDAVLSLAEKREQQKDAQRRFNFLTDLIHDLRPPVLHALLNHGVQLLEGDAQESFPESILLTGANKDNYNSAQYGRQCRAFLFVMQHLLAKELWTDTEKMDLIRTIFQQIKRFKSSMTVFKVMEMTQMSYGECSRALQLVKNNMQMAVMLLKTEGLGDEQTGVGQNILLEDIRTSLLLRLRLMVPFVSLIWEHPKQDECDILEWIKLLTPMLGNPLIHGNGSQEQFFEFVLDLVSLLVDEVPKDLRKTNLAHLSSMHGELVSVPPMFHSRVKRILPFLTHNIYLSNNKLASALLSVSPTNDPQQQQQHLESCMEQSKPWEWLEDYVSDPPHDNDTAISFTLFNAKKFKKNDSTYIRWHHYGFDDDKHQHDPSSGHIGMVGNRKQKKEPNANENGFVFIVDQGDESENSNLKQQQTDMEEGELP